MKLEKLIDQQAFDKLPFEEEVYCFDYEEEEYLNERGLKIFEFLQNRNEESFEKFRLQLNDFLCEKYEEEKLITGYIDSRDNQTWIEIKRRTDF